MATVDPKAAGFDAARLVRLDEAITADIAAERYDGCELVVARRGVVAYRAHHGFADRAAGTRVVPGQLFITMSIGKQLTVALVLRAIERGHFALTTPVADLIPAFAARGKARVTVGHVLTHTGGLPAMLPAGLAPDQVGNLAAVVAATCDSLLECRPGTRVVYSVIVGHAVLAELVRRADGGGRSFGRILREDLFEPLGMRDTWLGKPAHVAPRLAPVVARDRRLGLFDPVFMEAIGAIVGEESEIPAGGYVSSAPDMHRFAEMLRAGGVLDGVRILAPGTVTMVQESRTGDKLNTLWAYAEAMRGWPTIPADLGYGFFLRGTGSHPTPFGQMASPRTFGGFGAGSSAFWIDPATEVSYAFLSSGLMEDSYSIERHQRLADIVHAARC
ncbi:MAG TPA: serine hydrolase domain-containing protein [Candidatus Binatia bacterium]